MSLKAFLFLVKYLYFINLLYVALRILIKYFDGAYCYIFIYYPIICKV